MPNFGTLNHVQENVLSSGYWKAIIYAENKRSYEIKTFTIDKHEISRKFQLFKVQCFSRNRSYSMTCKLLSFSEYHLTKT